MDMSKYRDLFLSETREHLNSMNRLLVALEQAPGDRETIAALFREAHSIKGMAASMGYERTARLAHHLEDYLDACRATGQIPVGAIDRLLAGVDLLDGLLGDLEADRPERAIDAFMAEAQAPPAAAATPAPAPPPPEAPGPLVATEVDDEDLPLLAVESVEDEDDAEPPPAQPEPEVFQVTVQLDEQTVAPAARCLLILRELQKCGEIISARPTQEELRGGAPCRQAQAWLRTSLGKEHLEARLTAIADVRRVTFTDDRRREPAKEPGVRTVRVRTDLLDQFVNLTGELITHRYMLQTAAARQSWADLDIAMGQTRRLIDDLHHHVLQARLMPFESITGQLPRLVRDLARKTGKEVTLQLHGGNVGIDRVILEAISDPLIHLVRNAVDHGIATSGEVVVAARREKDLAIIEVSDNGRGMDPDALRRKALERGLLSAAQAEALSDRDALMLVCQPGFSTAAAITETSGRGVGMDVVKAAVENLGGSLEIQSAPGEGSRFQLRLPLSVAIIKILLVSCAGQPLAVPFTRVQRTLDLEPAQIVADAGRLSFQHGEEQIGLVPLAELLGLAVPPTGETAWVILTEVQGRRVGLQVDRFLGQRDAFVKSLDFPFNRLPGMSGATVDGDGTVLFIIDPQSLLERRTADLRA